ncbi:hypothetical protein B0H17DRAFT_1065211 [Mycena rosella]|uniref:Uncharacterized protein n=1 Tax=Mycena rosella TaxID=1033263 RepID=A0AAD7GE25_MYCRO|nr:hypothetical protein B0H17DRAFT_1065211 [Mycena rosella]
MNSSHVKSFGPGALGFSVLLWAAIRSLLTSFSTLLVRSERTTIATEQLATNRPTTQKPLKLASPDSFNGSPDKVEGFLNALTL